jgi:quercetin dioxygenase-like cupin family protein
MITLQKFLIIFFAVLLSTSVSLADENVTSATLLAPVIPYKAKLPIVAQSGDYELVSVIYDFGPGAGVPLHKHGGQVLVLVLSGELTLHENGTERIVKQGDSWTESPGHEHWVVNNGSEITRVAVSVFMPKGAEATTIIKH